MLDDEGARTPAVHLLADLLLTGAIEVETRVVENGYATLVAASAIQLDGDVVTRFQKRCAIEPALGHLHLARVHARLGQLREAAPVMRATGAVAGSGTFLLGAGGLEAALAPETWLATLVVWLAPGALGGLAGYLTPRVLRRLMRRYWGRYGPPRGDPDAAGDAQ